MNSEDEGEQELTGPMGYEDGSGAGAGGIGDVDGGFVGGSFSNVAQGLSGHYQNIMMTYWQNTINSIEHDDHEFKIHQLPLARIKKVMKADEDVKMISAEAPILFAKGCDIFITELTMRAWIHAEENKRRTLQRSDIASALQKSDMFDFLIDIVPREEAMASTSASASRKAQQQAQYAQYEDADFVQQQQQAVQQSVQQADDGEDYIEDHQYEGQAEGHDGVVEDSDEAAAAAAAAAAHAAGVPVDGTGSSSANAPIFNDIGNIYNGFRQY